MGQLAPRTDGWTHTPSDGGAAGGHSGGCVQAWGLAGGPQGQAVCPRTRAHPCVPAPSRLMAACPEGRQQCHPVCPAGPGLQPHRTCLLTLNPLPKPPEHQGQPLPWRGSGWEQAPRCQPTGAWGWEWPSGPRGQPPCPGEGVEQDPGTWHCHPCPGSTHPPAQRTSVPRGARPLLTAVISHGVCLSLKPRRPRKNKPRPGRSETANAGGALPNPCDTATPPATVPSHPAPAPGYRSLLRQLSYLLPASS